MLLILAIIIFVIIVIISWWLLGVYNVRYPGPDRPDGDFTLIIDEYQSLPKELWFRNKKCIYNEYLGCLTSRYIVFESNGDVIYDSVMNPSWEGWVKHREICHDNRRHKRKLTERCYESAESIVRSVEYIRAASLTQGIVVRGNLNNLCEMVKQGDRYRLVHVSQYVYDNCDPEY